MCTTGTIWQTNVRYSRWSWFDHSVLHGNRLEKLDENCVYQVHGPYEKKIPTPCYHDSHLQKLNRHVEFKTPTEFASVLRLTSEYRRPRRQVLINKKIKKITSQVRHKRPFWTHQLNISDCRHRKSFCNWCSCVTPGRVTAIIWNLMLKCVNIN